MAGSPKKRERKLRTVAFTSNPNALELVCEWVSQGKSLVDLCTEMDVPYTQVSRWLNANDARTQEYARAREAGADVLADQMLGIADEMPPTTNSGGLDSAYVAWQKSRLDTRRWIASKLKPRVYGDKQTVDMNVTTHEATLDDLA